MNQKKHQDLEQQRIEVAARQRQNDADWKAYNDELKARAKEIPDFVRDEDEYDEKETAYKEKRATLKAELDEILAQITRNLLNR